MSGAEFGLLDGAAKRRAEGVVRRRKHARVFGADLRARAHDAAGEGRDDVVDLGDRVDRGFSRFEEASAIGTEDQHVAAADGVGRQAGFFFDRRTRRP